MGLFEKMKNGLARTKKSISVSMNNLFADFSGENEEFYEELEETLICADAGAVTAAACVEALRDKVHAEGLRGGEEVKRALREILVSKLSVGDRALNLSTTPSVILVVGVNGVGKTTTIGKLAANLTAEGKKVLLCAADTFRAAAAEQLEIWADRAGCGIVRHEEGSDPAAVVFDALAAARSRGCDAVIIDTAGRLHNKQNLMNELGKIRRIIGREMPESAVETLLVLDAVTGQNGLLQAEAFLDCAELTGIVLTKLDGTARGGIVFSIAEKMGIPVKYIGVGEQIDDLMPFDPAAFADELLR